MRNITVLITVDTELSTHKDDMGIVGNIGGSEYCLPMFSSLLKKYGLPATFFVDVYTERKKHLQVLINNCLKLYEEGNALELHTHPENMLGQRGIALKDYDINDQIELIKRGVDMFYDCFGFTPLAHRAGDWGADMNTFEALRKNDIDIDSSMFYGWENCLLNGSLDIKNKIKDVEGVIEIPATVFECVPLGMFSKYRLLSTDGNSLNETISIIKKMQSEDVGIVNLVYHSFSFLKWNKERTEYSVNKARLSKFEKLLKNLKEDNTVNVETIRSAKDNILSAKDDIGEDDILIKRGLLASFDRFIDRIR